MDAKNSDDNFIAESDVPLAAGLYVVATPLGNMGDITHRALDVLARTSVIYCEDTRVSSKLLRYYRCRTRLVSLHTHGEASLIDEIDAQITQGAALALVSDAGTPLISDPGARLVSALRERGRDVFAVPGASAPIAALSIAGFLDTRFCFIGFLPPRGRQRDKAIVGLPRNAGVLVLFESPNRIVSLLEGVQSFWGDVSVVILREMTKLYEEVLRGTASELVEILRDAPRKGEFVVLISPPSCPAPSASEIDAALLAALGSLSVRDAAAQIADAYGLSRRDVYARALRLNKD